MKGYYASIRNHSETRHGFLAGPFLTHDMALTMVEPARRKAYEVNRREAIWSGFGTCSIEDESPDLLPAGVLNQHLGVTRNTRGWAQIPEAYRDAYRLRLNARITGPQEGSKTSDEYQQQLVADAEKIRDYTIGRRRNSGCHGFLSTLLMQRRFPHINNQEEDW
jgi:hypothetical protein